MTKQIREYLEHLRLFLDGEHSREEYAQELERLKVRIGFFSHERIVHMFIMLAFAVFFLMTFFAAPFRRKYRAVCAGGAFSGASGAIYPALLFP